MRGPGCGRENPDAGGSAGAGLKLLGGGIMPERYRSDKRTIGQLLSLSSPPIEVSSIQRDYSWDPSQVRTFWEDLLSFADTLPVDLSTDQEYFLGSVVLADLEGFLKLPWCGGQKADMRRSVTPRGSLQTFPE